MSAKKIRVLIVDDSVVIQRFLKQLIESSSNIEVMGTAENPFEAAKIIEKEVPDVITLDIEMPKMDGLTFLKKIMAQYPLPVIVVSSKARSSTPMAVEALELGAFAIFPKSNLDLNNIEASARRLIDHIERAAEYKPRRLRMARVREPQINIKANKPSSSITKFPATKIIAIGASTGGTEAIREVLEQINEDSPGILIVIHMPENFTNAFATRLNQHSKIEVREAVDGDKVLNGTALVARGGHHLRLEKYGAEYRIRVEKTQAVNRHMPSVDVLFDSVAQHCTNNAIGVILTGMGGDGASGLKHIRDNGGYTIAQDEKSCVVFGMPRVAIELGGVSKILPLNEIASNVNNHFIKGI